MSGASEGTRQKSTFCVKAKLASVQAPRRGENLCFFQMVPGSRDTVLVSVKFCIFTVNDSKGGKGWCVGKNHDDKSCWSTFSGKIRKLPSASYAGRIWLPVCFPIPQAPGAEELEYAQFRNTLMRRMPVWGRHYCEHLWDVEFNWATANVYRVWKE